MSVASSLLLAKKSNENVNDLMVMLLNSWIAFSLGARPASPNRLVVSKVSVEPRFTAAFAVPDNIPVLPYHQNPRPYLYLLHLLLR